MKRKIYDKILPSWGFMPHDDRDMAVQEGRDIVLGIMREGYAIKRNAIRRCVVDDKKFVRLAELHKGCQEYEDGMKIISTFVGDSTHLVRLSLRTTSDHFMCFRPPKIRLQSEGYALVDKS